MAQLRARHSFENNPNYTKSTEGHKEAAAKDGWESWVDGYPVVPELVKLFGLVPPAIRQQLVLYPTNAKRIVKPAMEPDIFVFREFSVFMGDCPFDVCRVGFGEYGVTKDVHMYSVYSRKIKNSKYRPHRDQFNMVMCRDAEKAAKNLKTYLIPMTHTELARAYYSEMRSHVSSEEARIRQEYERSIISAVGRETDTIGEELALLYKQGVTFNNPDIQSSAKAIAETRDVYKADIGRRVDATFVRFRTLNGEQFVEVVTTPNVRVYSTPTAVSGESTKLYTMAELPQDIGEGVAVLTILEDGQYVPKVGMRVNETTFWIERG